MTIAQSLINNNHIVKIHDTALEGWNNKKDLGNNKVLIGQSDKEIKNVIEEFNPDIVGISILFSNLNESGHTIASITKKYKPKNSCFNWRESHHKFSYRLSAQYYSPW